MIRIIRGRSSSALDVIHHRLSPDVGESSVDRYRAILEGLMAENPDQVYLLLALDDEKQNEKEALVAYLIAIAHDSTDFVLISQAWCRPGETKTADLMFLRMISWANETGRPSLRMETVRDAAAFTRRWGFRVVSQTMELVLQGDFEAKLLEKLGHENLVKVVKDGSEQSEKREHVDSGAEGSGDRSGGLPAAADRQGSDTLHGSASGTAGSEVWAASRPDSVGDLEPA
mgnify:CR=1 FL=1